MEWAYEFAAGAVFIALLLRSRFVDRFRESAMTTPPRFYLGLMVYMLGPFVFYTCLASLIYRYVGLIHEESIIRILCSPIWIALLTVAFFTGLFQFQKVEGRIRQLSHRVAGIPDLALRLRNGLRSAGFTMSPEIADAVRLNLLRRGIELEDIEDARHNVLQSRLATTTALMETIDRWARERGSRRFRRAVDAERIRLRGVVDSIAFRVTSTNRGLHDVSEVLTKHKPVKEAEGSLWDTLDASAEQGIYTGENDLMAEVMGATRFVYDDLREDLRKAHDEICLLIAQGILRYEYTNQRRRDRLQKLGFAPIELPAPTTGALFYSSLILLVGLFAASVVTSSTSRVQFDPLAEDWTEAVTDYSAAKKGSAEAIGAMNSTLKNAFDQTRTPDREAGVTNTAPASAATALLKVQILVKDQLLDQVALTEVSVAEVEEEAGWSLPTLQTALRVMLLALVQISALFCAIYPKYHFTWANESLAGRRPWPFIAGIGPVAGMVAIAIAVPFHHLLENLSVDSVPFAERGYPLAIMAAATAACMAWLIQDRTWRKVPSVLRRRIMDGCCLLAAWALAIVCIWQLPSTFAGDDVSWPLVFALIAVLGFSVGFVVPTTFRRKRPGTTRS